MTQNDSMTPSGFSATGSIGRSKEDPSSEERWAEAIAQPVSRAELLDALHVIHSAFLAHSAFEASIVRGLKNQQVDLATQAIDASSELLKTMQLFIERWNADDR